MAGLALIGMLIGYFGADAVFRSLLAVGWAGFATICLIHLALMAVMGIAWWALLPRTKLWISIWGRLVRDAGSEVLPLSQVGGYVLGARAIAFAGVPGTAAAASTIVDVSLEFVSQIAFTGLALGWLMRLWPAAPITTPVAIGLAVAAKRADDVRLPLIGHCELKRVAPPVLARKIAHVFGLEYTRQVASRYELFTANGVRVDIRRPRFPCRPSMPVQASDAWN